MTVSLIYGILKSAALVFSGGVSVLLVLKHKLGMNIRFYPLHRDVLLMIVAVVSIVFGMNEIVFLIEFITYNKGMDGIWMVSEGWWVVLNILFFGFLPQLLWIKKIRTDLVWTLAICGIVLMKPVLNIVHHNFLQDLFGGMRSVGEEIFTIYGPNNFGYYAMVINALLFWLVYTQITKKVGKDEMELPEDRQNRNILQ